MNCEQIINNIPKIIKHEVQTPDRIMMIEHIKSCKSCRFEYHKFLKIYYTADYNLVLSEPEIDSNLIDVSSLTALKTNKKPIIWAIAASFLIFTVSMFLVLGRPDTAEQQSRIEDKTISQKLANEDWQEISKIIQDKSELKKFQNEKIQVDLLLVKLEMFDRNSINRLKFEEFTEEKLSRRVKLTSVIDALKKYKKYNSELTMSEISKYLDQI
jgi:hypothetical protein